MIESLPIITRDVIASAFSKMGDPGVVAALSEINQRYLYWSDVKYKKVGSLTDKELWAVVQLSRLSLYSFEWPAYGIRVPVTNHMQELCHYFDMNFGGVWGTDSIVPKDNRELFLTSSMMEEAIASSQIEGASTTRRVAKDMLRKNITPRNKAEQMIHNNYAAIRYISENKDHPLTEDMILRLHELMTENTLENKDDAGRFRTNNEVVVADGISGEVVHYPPDYKEIPGFVRVLCEFANSAGTGVAFVHPIIKAITIHYLVAFYHPFVDGNGRTARALFYWFMLKSGYWLTEYLSISSIIYHRKASYEKAYLYAEKDGNDIGYFLTYNLDVLKLSFDALKKYIETKIAQKQRSMSLLSSIEGINHRQATILAMFGDNPSLALSVNDLVTEFGVSKPTVKSDLSLLVERGYLNKIPINHKQCNYVKGAQFDKTIG